MVDTKSERRNILTLVLLIIYLLVLTWLILFKLQFSIPYMKEGRVINIIPHLGSFDNNGVICFSEIRVNIFAFIPLGIYICMLKAPRSFVKKLLAIVSLTFAFEIIQQLLLGKQIDYELITDIVRWRVKQVTKGRYTI